MGGRCKAGEKLVSMLVCTPILLTAPLMNVLFIKFKLKLIVGSISTADGSALVRMGDTTMVCGIKAEVAEPDAATPNEGYISEFWLLEVGFLGLHML